MAGKADGACHFVLIVALQERTMRSKRSDKIVLLGSLNDRLIDEAWPIESKWVTHCPQVGEASVMTRVGTH
jgi:hypothetical protein